MLNRNPFIVSGRIDPEFFCDRVEESRRLVSLLVNGNNVVLISPRRMGKTGLVQFCYQMEPLRDDYNLFYVDILQTTGLKELAYALGKEVFRSLVPRGKSILHRFVAAMKSLNGRFGFDPFTGLPTFDIGLGDIEMPEYTLDEIFSFLESTGKRVILAIDEFQQIAKYPERNVEALLRSRIQQCSNINMVFAGSERHILHQMFTSDSRPFYNSASIMELGAIDPQIYRDFVESQFAAGGRHIDPMLPEYVYNLFDGVTFYMQKVFNYSYSATDRGEMCVKGTVDTAISDLLFSYDAVYREILSAMPMRQKELLYAVAGEGSVEGITSSAFIRRNALSSASSVQSALKKLMVNDFVSFRNRRYSVNDKLLRLWINRCM